MADNKKKGFSLDKGKETKSEGFNISKGDKTTSSFGLDKGSKKVSSKKTVVSKKSDTKKSSVVKDSAKSSNSTDPQKTSTQTTSSQNTKSNNSKLYALIGIAIVVVVFLIFSGDEKSTNPSSLSNEVVENSGSNLDGLSGENEMDNDNEMSVDNSNDSNDSGNNSDDLSTVASSDVNTNKENNQSNSSLDNNNVVADSSENANNSINTSNSESNSSVAENSTTTNSQSSNSKQISFSNNDILYYFQFGSSYINPNDRVLNKLADELKSNNSKIKLVGHTDSTGSEAVNLEISKSRAQAVFSFLVSKGVNRNLISVDGLGESKPLNGNSNAEERSSNRRVEIILN